MKFKRSETFKVNKEEYFKINNPNIPLEVGLEWDFFGK